MEPIPTGSLDGSSLAPSFYARRVIWRFGLAVGILGIVSFFVIGGLATLVMANYAGWGPQITIRGFQAVPVAILGGLLYGPRLALDHWYISAPVLALTGYSWFELRRLGREYRSRIVKQPFDSADFA